MPSANENVLGEGLLEALFMQLWSKDEDSRSAKILIPDTIVYHDRHAEAWYLTGPDGYVKKKTGLALSPDLIFGAMLTRNDPASEVIACLTVPGEAGSVVEEYMDHRSLRCGTHTPSCTCVSFHS